MRVIATKLGIYQGRRRPGTEFDFPDSLCKKDKDGNLIPPSWCVPATDKAKKDLANAAKLDAKREREAAIAAAGPKRNAKGYASAENVDDLV